MPDSRISAVDIAEEWMGCTSCILGERRELRNACTLPLFGNAPGGVLFVGASPDESDEEAGLSFGGESGHFLKSVLQRTGFTESDFALTYITACRSCAPLLDPATNVPRTRRVRGGGFSLMFRDQALDKESIAACIPRVHEMIYSMDPMLVVGMGKEACSALAGSNVSVDNGSPGVMSSEITVPGVTHRAQLTAKRREWIRTIKGETHQPTEVYQVRYPMLAIRDYRRALTDLSNQSSTSTSSLFIHDIRNVFNVYKMYKEMRNV